MRKGSVFMRCGTCRKKTASPTCCAEGSVSWYFKVDVDGFGRRRQISRGGFPTEELARTAMRNAVPVSQREKAIAYDLIVSMHKGANA